MALMWIEGFETFGTTTGSGGSADVAAGMERKYADLKGVSSTAHNLTDPELAAGRSGGYSLRGTSTSGQIFSRSFGSGTTTDDTLVVGMAVKFPSFPSDQRILTVGRNYGNLSLQISSTGQIAAVRFASTVLGETASAVLTVDTWHYVEMKVVAHETAGSYEIRVDGVNVLSDTYVNTSIGADMNIVQFRLQSVGQEFDDVYICNIDGTKNNDFLGRVTVEALFPNADGDSVDWAPSSGTNHSALVNDNPADDDASYVASNTQDDTDLFAYDNLSAITTEPILGVQVNTDVRMSESPGDLDIMQPVKSGTTTADGSTVNIDDDSYIHVHRILEDDPATSNAWTASGLNAAQFGIKVGT